MHTNDLYMGFCESSGQFEGMKSKIAVSQALLNPKP